MTDYKPLTLNQIITLLDLYRGTNTQVKIETYKKDLKRLEMLDYVDLTDRKNPKITLEGQAAARTLEKIAF